MSKHHLLLLVLVILTPASFVSGQTPPKKMKVFLLAGQSNMVGWGDSLKLPRDLQTGSDRVLMFEQGKWQPLKPFKKASDKQQQLGMKEFSFGPEIAFAQEMQKAWPNETIGIVKFAIGGTSILAWKPDWSKQDADRVGQGKRGSLYKKLIDKLEQARQGRELEIVGFCWLQGGSDMKKVDVAKEYLENLESLVASVRKDTGVANLPFIYGSSRRSEIPDDLSKLVPQKRDGAWPAAEWVLKAQWDAQQKIVDARMVILRDIETHPMNVHYNTSGQLNVGKQFAQAFLSSSLRIGGQTPQQILTMFGAKGRNAATDRQLSNYRRLFGFTDTNGDSRHSQQEYIDNGRYLNRQARQGIFRASDSNNDGFVSAQEYVENRVITDEAKEIFERMNINDDSYLTRVEFLATTPIKDENLARVVFQALDSNNDDELIIPEFLRVWGRWARDGRTTPAAGKK